MKTKRWWMPALLAVSMGMALLVTSACLGQGRPPARGGGGEGEEEKEVPLPPSGDAVDQYRYAIECYLLALAIINDETPMLGGKMNDPQLKSTLYTKLFGAYNALGQECRKRDDLYNAVAVYADATIRFPSPLIPKPKETEEGGGEEGGAESEAGGALPVPKGPAEYWVDIPASLQVEMLKYLRVLHSEFANVLSDLRLNPMAYEEAQKSQVMDPTYELGVGTGLRLATILGYLQDAYVYGKTLAEVSSRSAQAQCDLGIACRRLGRNREAVYHYLESLKLDPDEEDGPGKNIHAHTVALNGLGVIYLQEDKLLDAEREFDKTIAKGDRLLEYIRQQSKRVAWERRHEREAFSVVSMALVNQGIVYRRQGRLDDATKVCRRAVELGEWTVGNGIREDEIIRDRIISWNARVEAQSGSGGEGGGGGGGGGEGGGTGGGGGETSFAIVTGLVSAAASAAAASGEEGGGGAEGGFGGGGEEGGGAGAGEGGTATVEEPVVPTVEFEAREAYSVPLANTGLCYRDRGVKAMPARHGSYDPQGSYRMLSIAADYLERAAVNDLANSEAWNNLGEVYMQLSRFEEAAYAFTFAVVECELREPLQLERYEANLAAAWRRLNILNADLDTVWRVTTRTLQVDAPRAGYNVALQQVFAQYLSDIRNR